LSSVAKGVQHRTTIWLELIGCHGYVDTITAAETVELDLKPVSWSDGFWHGAITWYSTWGLVSDIMQGKAVQIVTKEVLLDAPLLQGLRVRQHARGQPKHMYFPPAHLRTILATEPHVLSDLEMVYTWGEKMNEDMVKEVGRQYPALQMLDWLGTSETFLGIHRRFRPVEGVVTAHWKADSDTQVYIVDPQSFEREDGKCCITRVTQVNVCGEIVFCRPGFATMCMGYVGNQSHSEKKFMADPFGAPGGVLYRTGDMGRWYEAPVDAFGADLFTGERPQPEMLQLGGLASGASCCACTRGGHDSGRNTATAAAAAAAAPGGLCVGLLEVMGRNDDQIKVRGQMVNLVEVDTKATELACVRIAGCRAVTMPGGDTEVALFVVLAETGQLDEVRPELTKVMEVFAVPKFIEELTALPYNANGKLVRHRLPQPSRLQQAEAGEDTRCDDPSVEAQVLHILRSKLGHPVTIDANFFAAGGHSLLAAETVTAVRSNAHLQARITVGELFAHADVRALVQLITSRVRTAAARAGGLAAAAAEEEQTVSARGEVAARPVPAVTPRVSCMVRGPPPIQAYQTVSMGVWLQGELDTQALRRSLELVVQRHEALRSHFAMNERGQRFLVAVDAAAFPLPLREVDCFSGGLSEVEAERQANRMYKHDACFAPFDVWAAQPFDESVRQAPLVHFVLVRTSRTKHFFFYGAHHQVFDGFSDSVFWQDLTKAFAAFVRGEEPRFEPAVSYLDYALWQCETLYQSDAAQQAMMQVANLNMAQDMISGPRPSQQGVPCEAVVRNAPYYRGGPWTEASVPFSVTDRLRATARSHGATLFQAIIAVWHMWQFEMSESAAVREVGLGVTMMGRDHPGLEGSIGNFQFVAGVRTSIDGCDSFVDVLHKVKESFARTKLLADFAAFDHATWADIFENATMDQLPTEVANYVSTPTQL
jgi:acyl-CoA synthetase (AMP-forming)/AMP-acid ligase II/NRPS condensation-like uncharacterized protein